MKVNLLEYDSTFLEKSWYWLNDHEIKEKTNTLDFTKEEQEEWFKSISSKTDYLIWGVMFDNNPIGVCGLKNITVTDCEYWGYIGEKKYWGRGFGTQIMQLMINKAEELKLDSIWLKVLQDNNAAVKLYEKFGFRAIKQDDILIFMKKTL